MKIINKSTLGFVLTIAALSCLFTKTLLAWSTGPEAYRTGAPGDKGTCNDSGCHNSFSLNSGSAKFSITGPASYTPGKTIKLKVSFGGSSGKLHGFEMTAVDADNNHVGKFKAIGKITQVIKPNDYRGLKKEDKGTYIEHTLSGNKKKSWKVKWIAPANATGTVTFYAAGNDANGNGTYTGDYIYTTTLEISPSEE
ncbi:MAG: hypothetical protein HYV59_06840 [Planctomycetes bacterium]|nr:hypothetical protein [Planctomycetota bacterium]